MKTESVFYGLLLLILILKMNAIQGAAPLLIILLGTLSMLYFPMGFYFLSGKGIYNQHVLPTVLGMLSFSVVILGYLFRVMNWPGSNAMGLIGAIGTIAVAVVVAIMRSKADKSMMLYYNNMLIRCGLMAGFFVLILV